MESIEQVFRCHYPKMFLVARMLLGDEDMARDVVSDIFADMLNGNLRLPPDCKQGYFIVLTRNRCLNHLRKMATQDKVKASLTLDTTVEISQTEDQMVEKLDHEASKLDRMLSFIDSELTPQTSRIIKMHYRQKLTYSEISAELGISQAAVYKHLAQGLKRIKEQFNPKNNG